MSRQLEAGIETAFETVHNAAKLKAAVVGLHRDLAAKGSRKTAPPAAGGGDTAAGDAMTAAAVKAEADRCASCYVLLRIWGQSWLAMPWQQVAFYIIQV
jgi:hypothetical protein